LEESDQPSAIVQEIRWHRLEVFIPQGQLAH
jgi:hypothetical protein